MEGMKGGNHNRESPDISKVTQIFDFGIMYMFYMIKITMKINEINKPNCGLSGWLNDTENYLKAF